MQVTFLLADIWTLIWVISLLAVVYQLWVGFEVHYLIVHRAGSTDQVISVLLKFFLISALISITAFVLISTIMVHYSN